MLKREITYTDFSDDPKEHTEVFYFNITPIDVAGLEAEHKDGLQRFLEGMVKEEDRKGMLWLFQELILLGYGVRSEDRKEFVKTQELRDKFSSSAAYQQLCFELMSSETALNDFVIGALPKNITSTAEAQKILAAVPTTPDTTNPPVDSPPTEPPTPPVEPPPTEPPTPPSS